MSRLAVELPNVATEPLAVTVVTKIPSPYQVELFDRIAADHHCQPFVIYLEQSLPDRQWKPPTPRHDHLILEFNEGWEAAWKYIMDAPLVVFSYYTHPFAITALHARAASGKPWVLWGERPGFHQLGVAGRLFRKLMLRPLRKSEAPVWGIGKFAVEGYRREFGSSRSYVNLPYFSNLARYLSIQRAAEPIRQKTRFLFSGAFIRRKGVVVLARAFAALASEDRDCELIMMGAGPLRSALEEILSPVAERVSWLGFVQWADLPSGYQKADVLCVPSRYDGWGMVVVEGMAAGMPVIASSSMGAALELVQQDASGWLVPPDDDEALFGAMRKASKMEVGALRGMGEVGRLRARDFDSGQGALRFTEAAKGALHHIRQGKRAKARGSSSPRILLVGNYEPDRQYSMQRYGDMILRGLEESGLDVKMVKPPAWLGRVAPSQWSRKWLGFADKFGLFPAYLRSQAHRYSEGRESVVHILDQGNGFYLPFVADMPHLVTCHDLIAIKAGTEPQKDSNGNDFGAGHSGFQAYNRKTLKQARWLACVSEATRQDCIRYLNADPSRCKVIYNALDPFFAGETGARPERLPARYLLHVGGDAWYKNRLGLMQIYRHLRSLGCTLPLVLMGAGMLDRERTEAANLRLLPHIVSLEKPADIEIRAAYAHAEALIFPSLEEGFGWPILEALAQGTRVFTTRAAPMTEAGGAAACYIDTWSPELAARQIWEVLNTSPDGVESRAVRKAYAETFNISSFIGGYLDIYERILWEHR